MKKLLPLQGSKFPQKTFAVLAVIALIAFLLTLKPVAEAVKTAAEKVGITFPPLDVFRNVANSIKEVAIGAMVLLVGFAVGLVGIKIALITVAVASIVYAGYRIYNSFAKGFTQNTLPEAPTTQQPNNPTLPSTTPLPRG